MRVLSLSCRNSMSISCPISWIGSILRGPNSHHNHTCSIRHNRLLPFPLEIYRDNTFQLSQLVPSMSVNLSTRNTYTNSRSSKGIRMWWAEVGWTEVFPAIIIPRLLPSRKTRDRSLIIPATRSWEVQASICSKLMSSCRCRGNCSPLDTPFFI